MDELYYFKKKSKQRKDNGRFNLKRIYKKSRREDANANAVALNKPIFCIYAMTQDKVNFPTSFNARNYPKQKKGDNYYTYHKANGHRTNECKVLARIIQKLIREGQPKMFVKTHNRLPL